MVIPVIKLKLSTISFSPVMGLSADWEGEYIYQLLRYYVITKNLDGSLKTVFRLNQDEWTRYVKGKTNLSTSEIEQFALIGKPLKTPKEHFFTIHGRGYAPQLL